MCCGIFSASAQVYIKVRPARPVYVRTAAPSPRHVWIDEEWHERGNTYEWNGGRWAEPPHRGYRYQQGRWRHSDRGDRWQGGRWRH